MHVYLYIHKKYTQYTFMYYVNKPHSLREAEAKVKMNSNTVVYKLKSYNVSLQL